MSAVVERRGAPWELSTARRCVRMVYRPGMALCGAVLRGSGDVLWCEPCRLDVRVAVRRRERREAAEDRRERREMVAVLACGVAALVLSAALLLSGVGALCSGAECSRMSVSERVVSLWGR